MNTNPSPAARLARIEDAHDLRAAGEHPDHIAARLNVSRDRLDGYLRLPVPPPPEDGPEDDLPPSPVPALEPERRIARARPLAADLARCVAASDAEGVRILLAKTRDWYAVAIVLAECADPGRTAIVTQRQERQREEATAA
jgi:hypothetical protein